MHATLNCHPPTPGCNPQLTFLHHSTYKGMGTTPPAPSQYSVLIWVEVAVRLGSGLGVDLRLALGLVHALFGRLLCLLVGGTSFHCTMNDIGNFPPDLWWLIRLFLPPINAMQLLRIPSFFNRMRLRQPIVQIFMNLLIERLAEYMPYPSMPMGLLCVHNRMGDPRAIISGCTVWEGIQHERFLMSDLELIWHC